MNPPRILAIAPRPLVTDAALFEGDRTLFRETVRHPLAELRRSSALRGQVDLRRKEVLELFETFEVPLGSLSAVSATGGALAPIPGGVYRVSREMLADLASERYGRHASNLGALLAEGIAREAGCPAFVVDPISADERLPEAKITGLPEIARGALFHCLIQKAAARRAAEQRGLPYEGGRFVVAHIGVGTSVGAHDRGRVVDVDSALAGEGAFSSERAGALPAADLIRLAYGGTLDFEELMDKITRRGGLSAHLGTSSYAEAAERAAAGDSRAELVMRALSLSLAKEIAGKAAVLGGQVDAIVLSGEGAACARLVDDLRASVSWIAPIFSFPDEDELAALAAGAGRALSGIEPVRIYEDRTAL
jgi:butyrate kinase